MIIKSILPAALAALLAVPAMADETDAFAGVNWVFGNGGQGIEGVIGFAKREIDNDGDVTGARLSLHYGFNSGATRFKATGLKGKENAQAELGIGYDLTKGAAFGVVGAHGSYVNLGADIYFDGGLQGYAGVHSLEKLDKPAAPTTPTPLPVEDENPR